MVPPRHKQVVNFEPSPQLLFDVSPGLVADPVPAHDLASPFETRFRTIDRRADVREQHPARLSANRNGDGAGDPFAAPARNHDKRGASGSLVPVRERERNAPEAAIATRQPAEPAQSGSFGHGGPEPPRIRIHVFRTGVQTGGQGPAAEIRPDISSSLQSRVLQI